MSEVEYANLMAMLREIRDAMKELARAIRPENYVTAPRYPGDKVGR